MVDNTKVIPEEIVDINLDKVIVNVVKVNKAVVVL